MSSENNPSLILKLEQLKNSFSYQRLFYCLSERRKKNFVHSLINNSNVYKSARTEGELIKLIADLSTSAGWMWSLLYQWNTKEKEWQQGQVRATLNKISLSQELADRLTELTKLNKDITFYQKNEERLAADLIAYNVFAHYLGVHLNKKQIGSFEFTLHDFSNLSDVIGSIKATDLESEKAIQETIHLIGREAFDLKNVKGSVYTNQRLN